MMSARRSHDGVQILQGVLSIRGIDPHANLFHVFWPRRIKEVGESRPGALLLVWRDRIFEVIHSAVYIEATGFVQHLCQRRRHC